MNRVLCDTSFWLGLLDESDDYYYSANDWFDMFGQGGERVQFIIPYPSLYETMKTSFCNGPQRLSIFQAIVNKYGELIPDDDYRDSAYEKVYTEYNIQRKRYSLVDLIIRSIIEDVNVQKDYLLTNNYSDFFDIAQNKKVEILEVVTNDKFAKAGSIEK